MWLVATEMIYPDQILPSRRTLKIKEEKHIKAKKQHKNTVMNVNKIPAMVLFKTNIIKHLILMIRSIL